MKKKEKILVIDDEPSINEIMCESLEDEGYSVFSASNGVEGLKICAEKPMDVIVLDLNMPRMDGYMFMEHMTQRWEKDGRRHPYPSILVLTAVDEKKDLGLAKNLGALKYLRKPIKPSQLIKSIEDLLSDDR